MIREIRLMKTGQPHDRSSPRKRTSSSCSSSTRHKSSSRLPGFSPEQIADIKKVEDEIQTIETDNFAKQNLLEKRLSRLENIVKAKKLDGMLDNVSNQEKKVK